MGGFSLRDWRTAQVERAEQRCISTENLVQNPQDLRLDKDSEHTAETTQEWLRDNSVDVPEWPRLSPE